MDLLNEKKGYLVKWINLSSLKMQNKAHRDKNKRSWVDIDLLGNKFTHQLQWEMWQKKLTVLSLSRKLTQFCVWVFEGQLDGWIFPNYREEEKNT